MRDAKDLLIMFAILVGFIGLMGGISMGINSWQCGQRWAGSGMESRWDLGAGCRIKRKDGTWVPDKAMREVEQ